MIAELKELLQKNELNSAVIIDDAFDGPKVDNIEVHEGTFFDDIPQPLLDKLSAECGYDVNDVHKQPFGSPEFIAALWKFREELPKEIDVFHTFERTKAKKLDELAPLEAFLRDHLQIDYKTLGSDEPVDGAPPLIFLDMFLGYVEGDDAIQRAIARIKGIVAKSADNPPVVVLMSASPQLEKLGPTVRDDGELLGCQFRMLAKSELADQDILVDQIYDLVVSRDDALRLNTFINAWGEALSSSKAAFLRTIRSLDLADYAATHALALEAEKEPLGDYILDIYDTYLHSVLEGESGLQSAAKALNKINWTKYPPAQFAPSANAIKIMDGVLFHHEERTASEAQADEPDAADELEDELEQAASEVSPDQSASAEASSEKQCGKNAQKQKPPRLGHVFLRSESTTPDHDTSQERDAYVVLSQECDLQHGKADRLLLLQGRAAPYSFALHHESGPVRTPIMTFQKTEYSVMWNTLKPETWLISDLPKLMNDGLQLARRFRTPFALQLQQAFIAKLGRVGTVAAMPGRYPAGLDVYIKKQDQKLHRLLSVAPDDDRLCCLAGRDEKAKPRDQLLLSSALCIELRKTLRDVSDAELSEKGKLRQMRSEPAFFRSLRTGLKMESKENGCRPLPKYPDFQLTMDKRADAFSGDAKSFGVLVFNVITAPQ